MVLRAFVYSTNQIISTILKEDFDWLILACLRRQSNILTTFTFASKVKIVLKIENYE